MLLKLLNTGRVFLRYYVSLCEDVTESRELEFSFPTFTAGTTPR